MRAYFYAISTGSALIAFFLLRRLDAPLWLAFLQGLLVIPINGQYFKAYIPFLVLSNLFAITLFLTSQRKALLSLGAGILLGTTFLIRIDLGIFFSVVWFAVLLLHALLLNRRVLFNLLIASCLVLGVVAMHLPFIYDAHHRHFLPSFTDQYSNVAGLILAPILPHKPPAPPPPATTPGPALPPQNTAQPGSLQVPASPGVGEPRATPALEKPPYPPSAAFLQGNIFKIADHRKTASRGSNLPSDPLDLRSPDRGRFPWPVQTNGRGSLAIVFCLIGRLLKRLSPVFSLPP